MRDWIQSDEHRNYFTVRQHIRRFKRKLNLSWALHGRDVAILFIGGVLAGLFLGVAILTLGFK
jgi:hypothetical protein